MFFNLEQHKIVKQKKFKDGHLLMLYKASDSLWQLLYLQGETILKAKCYIFGRDAKVTREIQCRARADYKSCIELIWAGGNLQETTFI